MSAHKIQIPRSEEQHRRNWKWRWVEEVVVDALTGEERLVKSREWIVEGETPEGPVYEVGGEPIWGLGCPAGCGRFWLFIADETYEEETTDADGVKRRWLRGRKGAHFHPLDEAAHRGIDEEGNTTHGYLNFHPDPEVPSDVKRFECDRCGVKVELRR